MGVMEGESAIQAVYGGDAGKPENAAAVDAMRADYEHQLDAKFAGARGFVDAIITPRKPATPSRFSSRCPPNSPAPYRAFALPSQT